MRGIKNTTGIVSDKLASPRQGESDKLDKSWQEKGVYVLCRIFTSRGGF